jgi:hypothetical protein
VNDNELISKSKFSQISIPLSFGSVISLFLYIDFPNDIKYIYYLTLTIFIYNIFNIILCFLSLGYLNFVNFEQKYPIKSFIGRWSFNIPIIFFILYLAFI